MVNLNEFQNEVAPKRQLETATLVHLSMQLIVESTRVMNHVRKHSEGENLVRAVLIEGMGRVLWTIAQICSCTNTSMAELAHTQVMAHRMRQVTRLENEREG